MGDGRGAARSALSRCENAMNPSMGASAPTSCRRRFRSGREPSTQRLVRNTSLAVALHRSRSARVSACVRANYVPARSRQRRRGADARSAALIARTATV